MPQSHAQLGAMPQSKSSVGVDISESFVSSDTDQTDVAGKGLTNADITNSTSMLTSEESFNAAVHAEKAMLEANKNGVQMHHENTQAMLAAAAHNPYGFETTEPTIQEKSR